MGRPAAEIVHPDFQGGGLILTRHVFFLGVLTFDGRFIPPQRDEPDLGAFDTPEVRAALAALESGERLVEFGTGPPHYATGTVPAGLWQHKSEGLYWQLRLDGGTELLEVLRNERAVDVYLNPRYAALEAPGGTPPGQAPEREPETRAALKTDLDTAYTAQRDEFLAKHRRYPSRGEDFAWGQAQEPKITNRQISDLRNRLIPEEVRKGGKRSNKPVE